MKPVEAERHKSSFQSACSGKLSPNLTCAWGLACSFYCGIGDNMKIILLAAAASLVAAPALADAVQNAYLLCQVIDNTGLSSSPCEVSGWSGTVTATIDMDSANARETCTGMVGMLKQKSVRFEGRQWTLQIKSPYSGGNSIAYCDLPQ